MDREAQEVSIDHPYDIGSNGNQDSSRRNKFISVSRDDSYIIEGGSAFRSAPHMEEYEANNGSKLRSDKLASMQESRSTAS